jgi:hypothetical protein
LFSIQSCKDPLIQSKNLLTKGDTLNLAKDTLAITVTTVVQSQLNSSNIVDGMLGSMNDRNFGISYGSFYTQYQSTIISPAYGSRPVVDSVVLNFLYDLPYGPCTKPMNISVYSLQDTLSSFASYYTSSFVPVNTPPIGYLKNFVPDFIDSSYVYESGGNQPPQLRINLSKSFGYSLLNADSFQNLGGTNFTNTFKGLYVTASGAVSNGFIFCNLSSTVSGLTVYYRTPDSGDTVENPITFSLTVPNFNHFDNSYYGSPVYAAIHNPTSSQKIFLQGGGGTQAKILVNLANVPKNIGVNKAELIVAESEIDSQYAVPPTLSLLRIDDAGVGQQLDDISSASFGGYLQTDTLGGAVVNRYHFNISLYMQKLIEGIYNNNGLYLSIPGANSTPARVVLMNPPATDKIHRTYLTVTYTKL